MQLVQEAKNISHIIYPALSRLTNGLLGKDITIIGITGTDGKSTSVALLAHILRAAGHNTAHFSSVSIYDGNSEQSNQLKMTTPGRMRLHTFVRSAMRNGATHVVLEVTSQGIVQHRHRALRFSYAGLTNITPEHIEAHGSFKAYVEAKLSFMRSAKHQIVSEDAEEFRAQLPSVMPTGNYQVEVIEERLESLTLSLTDGMESREIETALSGPFAVKNIRFALSMAEAMGVSFADCVRAIETAQPIPGRFEIVSRRPLIIVDYAHTLAALEVLLPYVRMHSPGKLVHVFGAAGGGRDRYKRPQLAVLSQAHADLSVVTEENSFDEDTERILDEVCAGFSDMHLVERVPVREDALAFGLSKLGPQDTLLLTGKGSELVIAGPNGSKRPYTERTYIRWLLEIS